MSDSNSAIAKSTDVNALLAAMQAPVSPDSAKRTPQEGDKVFQPYVGFRGAKTEKNVDLLDAAGVDVGKFYLAENSEYIPLVPADLHLIRATKVFVKETDTDGIVDATFEDRPGMFDEGFRPIVYAAVAVVLNNGEGASSFVPATLILRNAQTRALETAMKMVDPYSKPPGVAMDVAAWSKRSDKHKASAGVKFPGGRFRLRISSTLEKVKDTARTQNVGHGQPFPTPAVDVAALNEWVAKDADRIAAVVRLNEDRIEECRKLANGGK